MNNLSNQNLVTEKARELNDLAKSIFDNSLTLAKHDKGQEIIEEKIDSLKYGLQKEIVEERCPESGKPKHTNDLARKSELTMREQSHEPLRMLKADRLDHIETTKNLQALIEFQKRQFVIGEKMLGYLGNQSLK